jgi:flavin-dependent thymidylate synthase
MNIRDKHTDMDEIHREEEKYLLGNQIPFNLADRPEQEIAGYESINVRLLHPSNSIVESELFQDWVRGAVITALTTWGSTSDGMNRVLDLANDPDSAVMALTEILCDRHISAVLESFAFTFYIDGIPRTMSHQIVRHRGMAFGQQSLRVSSCYGDVVRAPQDAINRVLQLEREIEETDSQIKAAEYKERLEEVLAYLRRYADTVAQCRDVYRDGVAMGFPVEQVRNIMPMGTTTKLCAVMRLRELVQYLRDRSQGITQGEHHNMAALMAQAVAESCPNFWRLVLLLVPEANRLLDILRVEPFVLR